MNIHAIINKIMHMNKQICEFISVYLRACKYAFMCEHKHVCICMYI